MRARTLLESFNYALAGWFYAIRTQRNMRIHCLTAVLVFLLGYVLHLSSVELAVLILTAGLVIMAEMLNTAIEVVVDLITQEYHPLAKIAKNVAAGSVLVTALAAMAIGFLLFFDKIADRLEEVPTIGTNSSCLLILVPIGVIVASVVVFKLSAGYHHVQGGMPSGHVAVAFGLATSAHLLGASGPITLVAFILASLVAQSRLEARIHRWPEVAAGGLIGIAATILLFELLT
ncbi:MAG: phosphatase PAP2 family protein [Firmicutes bacterium]|nr:phosphatase PAP2 family protein [Bacillota bacterium]